MRYLILKPTAPVDPRTLKLASTLELHAKIPPLVECEHERAAVAFVRKVMPDAVGMLFPIQIGSGQTVLLGFVADDVQRRAVDPEKPIHFELIVQPVPQNEGDRVHLKRRPGEAFTRALWKVPPEPPDLYKRHAVEIRATDAEVPIFVDALVGRDQRGRLLIYADVAGIQMSMHFDDKAVTLDELPPGVEIMNAADGERMLAETLGEDSTPAQTRSRTLSVVEEPRHGPTTDEPPRSAAPPGYKLELWRS